MLWKHQKYYFLVSDFCWKISKTYFIIKIRGEINLKINWSVKTPLHGHNGVAHSGLWVPAFSECSRYKDNKLIWKEDNSRPQYKPLSCCNFFSCSVNNLKRVFHRLHLLAILRVHATLFKHTQYKPLSCCNFFSCSVNNLKRVFHRLHLLAILRVHATLFKHFSRNFNGYIIWYYEKIQRFLLVLNPCSISSNFLSV